MGNRFAVQVRYVSGLPQSLTSNGLWTRTTTGDRRYAVDVAGQLNTPHGRAELEQTLNEDPSTEGVSHRVLDVFVQPLESSRNVSLILHTRTGVVTEQATVADGEIPPVVFREAMGAPGVTLQEEYALRANQRDVTLDSYHYDLT